MSTASIFSIIKIIFFIAIGTFVTWKYAQNRKKAREERRSLEISEEGIVDENQENDAGIIYSVEGVRGRHLDVYEDKVSIKTKANVAAFITGNGSDGEKTIYFADVIGVQFKKSGVLIGYLQFETASSQMNNRHDNFFNENSFTFTENTVSNAKMEYIAKYVKKQINNIKNATAVPIVQNVSSSADELLKYKQLLDAGVITQEEFDIKKSALLK